MQAGILVAASMIRGLGPRRQILSAMQRTASFHSSVKRLVPERQTSGPQGLLGLRLDELPLRRCSEMLMIKPHRFDKQAKSLAEGSNVHDPVEIEITGPAHLLQSCLEAGADIFKKPLKALLSPFQPVTLPVRTLDEMKVPRQARSVAFFYPCEALSKTKGVRRDLVSSVSLQSCVVHSPNALFALLFAA